MRKRGNSRPLSSFVTVILVACSLSSHSAIAAEIIVNKSVPGGAYSKEDLRAIFSMQKRFWSTQRQIKVFVLPDGSQIHKDFVKNSLNMFPHQLRRVWDRLTYSGTGIAPVELSSEQEMAEKIANTPDSIGYIAGKPDYKNVRFFEYY